MGFISEVTQVRQALIASLADQATQFVMDPTPGEGETAWRCFSVLLNAYTEVVTTATNSSSATYALRDLPYGEKRQYDQVRRAVHLLGIEYGPKAVEPRTVNDAVERGCHG